MDSQTRWLDLLRRHHERHTGTESVELEPLTEETAQVTPRWNYHTQYPTEISGNTEEVMSNASVIFQDRKYTVKSHRDPLTSELVVVDKIDEVDVYAQNHSTLLRGWDWVPFMCLALLMVAGIATFLVFILREKESTSANVEQPLPTPLSESSLCDITATTPSSTTMHVTPTGCNATAGCHRPNCTDLGYFCGFHIKNLVPGTYTLCFTSMGTAVAEVQDASKGAIYTSDVHGTVNRNIYECEGVYLGGGPDDCRHKGSLPPNYYYFQVTNPSGTLLLSGAPLAKRIVYVNDSGYFINSTGGTYAPEVIPGNCPSTIYALLQPFNDTDSPANEYKVWVTPVQDYVPGGANFGFASSRSKTDNFKYRCRHSTAPPTTTPVASTTPPTCTSTGTTSPPTPPPSPEITTTVPPTTAPPNTTWELTCSDPVDDPKACVTFTVSKDGKLVTSWNTTIPIDAVLVTGNNCASNVYSYVSEVTSDTGLGAPPLSEFRGIDSVEIENYRSRSTFTSSTTGHSNGCDAQDDTMGYTSVSGWPVSGNENRMSATYTFTTLGGSVTKLWAYITHRDHNSHNRVFQMAIYNGSYSSGPSQRIAVSSDGVVPERTGWASVTINATLAPSSHYWIVYNTNARDREHNNLYYATGGATGSGGNKACWKSQPFGTWPATFGACDGSLAGAHYTMYAEFAPCTPVTTSATTSASTAAAAAASASLSTLSVASTTRAATTSGCDGEVGCDGVPCSGLVHDACGICGGNNSTCQGCDHVPNSGKVLDVCGVCGGDNSSCTTPVITDIEFCYDYELGVNKTAQGFFDRLVEWLITKTATPWNLTAVAGNNVTTTYTVTLARHEERTNVRVLGSVTVSNPSPMRVNVTVSDVLVPSGGGVTNISCSPGNTIDPYGSIECGYSITDLESADDALNFAVVNATGGVLSAVAQTPVNFVFSGTERGHPSVLFLEDMIGGEDPITLGPYGGSVQITYNRTFTCPSTFEGNYGDDGLLVLSVQNVVQDANDSSVTANASVTLTCEREVAVILSKQFVCGRDSLGRVPFVFELRNADTDELLTTVNVVGDFNETIALLSAPGNYSVTEVTPLPDGWVRMPASGRCNFTTSEKGNDKQVLCAFVNIEMGRLCVELHVQPNDTISDGSEPIPWQLSLYRGHATQDSGELIGFEVGNSVTCFEDLLLSPLETYTLCERIVPAGWSSYWQASVPFTDLDNSTSLNDPFEMDQSSPSDTWTDTIVPFNLNRSDPTQPSSMGNLCYSLTPGESPHTFTIRSGRTTTVHMYNVRAPDTGCNASSSARSTPYWTQWNLCNQDDPQSIEAVQFYNAAGGAGSAFPLIDDILAGPYAGHILWDDVQNNDTFVFDISNCSTALAILQMRDLVTNASRRNDAAYILARTLLTAQLNFGAEACVCANVTSVAFAAENLLDAVNFDGTGAFLPPPTPQQGMRNYALTLASKLEKYSDGLLC